MAKWYEWLANPIAAGTSAIGSAISGGDSQPGQPAQPIARPAGMTKEEFEKTVPKIDLASQIEEAKKREGGYTAEQNEAMWSRMAGRLSAQEQAQARALAGRQAQMGVRGGAGAAQLGRQQQQFAAQRAMASQELGIKNIEEMSKRLRERQQLEQQQQLAEASRGALLLQVQEAERDRLAQEAVAREARIAQEAAANKSGGCCFIFLEARYGNGTMDSVVRRFRDERMTARNKRGYYKVAQILVPLMRKSKIVKFATRVFMTDPLVSYGKAYYGQGKVGLLFKPVATFWLKAFEFFGQDHPFIRENGETV